jgi:hypothetical protein
VKIRPFFVNKDEHVKSVYTMTWVIFQRVFYDIPLGDRRKFLLELLFADWGAYAASVGLLGGNILHTAVLTMITSLKNRYRKGIIT